MTELQALIQLRSLVRNMTAACAALDWPAVQRSHSVVSQFIEDSQGSLPEVPPDVQARLTRIAVDGASSYAAIMDELVTQALAKRHAKPTGGEP